MEKALLVFSACGELVDDAIGVDFAGFQAARGTAWVYGAFCQVDLLDRVRTNPVAHLFARRLLLPAGQPSLREHAQELPNPK